MATYSYLETKQGRIHYRLIDLVPPWIAAPEYIVFHHGIAANLHVWSPWIPVLARRYRLVTFDMRGFGDSHIPASDFAWSFDVLVADLLAVADAAGARKFHLVGESIGGTVAIACALRAAERLLSLTLSNAAARGGLVNNVTSWRDTLSQHGQAAWATQMMQQRFHPGALPRALHDWYWRVHAECSMAATLGLADLLLAADLTDRLSSITTPALLLCPDASPFIPAQVMSEMRARIPNAQLQVFAHSKHGLPLSHGTACAQTLLDFLDRRSAA